MLKKHGILFDTLCINILISKVEIIFYQNNSVITFVIELELQINIVEVQTLLSEYS